MPNSTAYTEGNNNHSSAIEGENGKKYCPNDSRLLIFRKDIQRLFCVECGFTPDKVTEEDTFAAAADEFENMKIRPLPNQAGMNRRQQAAEDLNRRHLQYNDSDFERMQREGYNIVESREYLPTDNSTYDSNEVRGSFSNLTSQRRVYYR